MMEKYAELTTEWNRAVATNMVLLECTKHNCGYAFFIQVYQTSTIADVHNMVCDHIGSPRNSVMVYLRASNMPEVRLNNTDPMTVLDMTRAFRPYMVPIYPIPAKVAYRIYIDDGHCSGTCGKCK
jgi:hypothetical protein